MKKLQIFISSPGDVIEERAIAQRVIERLQSEFMGRVKLEPVLWEHEPLVATANFQEQIVHPSDTDVVIAILWSRLGTRLPKGFTRPDGSRYDSGTEYEFEEAIAGFREKQKPDLLVYRKTAPPSVRLDNEQELMERLQQKKKLDEFVDKWFHDQAEGTLIAAFHAFESPSDFEELVETHLHKLVERSVPETYGAVDFPAVWQKGSPFRGLHAFEFEHAPVFFGRTKAVSDVLQALREQAADDRSFVLILGMSGGGKSSAVRAGVLPMLTQPGVIEDVGLWRRAVYRPSDVPQDLFTGLATALLRDHGLPSLDPESAGPGELAQVLRESPQAAVSLIKSALSQEADKYAKEIASGRGRTQARLALLVDQMEEMFTQQDIDQQERQAFVKTLDALARCGRVWIIATLRSDFYPRLAKYPELVELKEGAGQYDLLAPTASEIGQMIRLPTRAAGLRFEEDSASTERLDDMLRDAAVEHPEVLPLLQFTLEELYQRRTDKGVLTFAAYRELGGVEGSLAQRAETVFQELPGDIQAALPRILDSLISIDQDGHGTIGRKRASWSESMTAESQLLLEAFVNARLFVTELSDSGAVIVTVAHEALLWHWPRVREWIEQNRENLRIHGRVTAAAERWRSENRPADLLLPAGKPLGEAKALLDQDIEFDATESEFIVASMGKAKRAKRLRGAVVASIATLGVLALAAAFLANQQRTRAEIEAETARQATDFMVRLFEVSDPSEALGNSITAREILDKGASRIEAELADQPEIQANLMQTMGTVYSSLGLYDSALPLADQALRMRRELFGAEHPDVAGSLNNLGVVQLRTAEYEAAERNLRESLGVRRKSHGDASAEVAETLANLAEVLSRRGEFKAAEPLIRESLDIRRVLHGDSHADIAASLEDLGLNFYEQGNLEAAVTELRAALSMRRALHGDVHPDLAAAINNLAFVMKAADQLDEAGRLYREALEMDRRLLGDVHPSVAADLNNVGRMFEFNDDLVAAERAYREALDINRQIYGDSHPDIAGNLSNIAFVRYARGDNAAAIGMLRESLDMQRNILGAGHPAIAGGATNLAHWLTGAGQYDESERLLDEALEIRRRALGNDHPQTAGTLTVKADLMIATKRYAEGKDLAREAREILERALPDGHWRIAAAANTEGAALTGTGDFAEAEKLLLQSREGLMHAPIPELVERGQRRLFDLYAAWGKPGEAAKYRRKE